MPEISISQEAFDPEALFTDNGKTGNYWLSARIEDEYATLFLIKVDKNVPFHLYKDHTEIVYILRGKDTVPLVQENHSTDQGDLGRIPEQDPRSLYTVSQEYAGYMGPMS